MRTLLLVTLLGVAVSLQAQNKEILDQASVQCYYRFMQSQHGTDGYQIRTDTLALMIGNQMSMFYNPTRLLQDSLLSTVMKVENIKSINVFKDPLTAPVMSGGNTYTVDHNDGTVSYHIYKDRTKGKITVIDYVNAISGERYQYEDPIGQLSWKIEQDTTTILAHVCQKATVSFRGRNYIAWFAPEIPVNDGPWKFFGLPGLILKVNDDQNLFLFECVGIQALSPKQPIVMKKLMYVKCSRKDFEKIKYKTVREGLNIHVNGGNVTMVPKQSAFGNKFPEQMEVQ